ncbi:MAG: tail fiber domain-containing protein [Planctomycetaceae bacterium]|nr:tail fiber domain-containing protein [Planctomycetaceae bacterium]
MTCFIATGSAQAQTLTGTDLVLTAQFPKIIFDDNMDPTYSWSIAGTNGYFGIFDKTAGAGISPFRIAPGAPDSSIKVEANGRIGFGTFSPQRELHVVAGDQPTIRLEQDTSSGFPAQTWDLEAHDTIFAIYNQTGTTNTRPLRIRSAAPNDTLYLAAAGNVGIGTASPDVNSQLDIRSTGKLYGFLTKRTDAGSNYARVENPAGAFRLGVQANGDAQLGALNVGKQLALLAGGSSKMVINGSGQFSFGNPPPPFTTHAMMTSTGAHLTAGGAWTNSSSRALKQDIEPITSDEARETVRALQPVGYRYKSELDERYVGFIAEDVPELVATRDRKGLAPMDITAVLTKVVQDQDRTIARLEKADTVQQTVIDKQQQLIDSLSRRLVDLERKAERVE